jgi:hypothetical protein
MTLNAVCDWKDTWTFASLNIPRVEVKIFVSVRERQKQLSPPLCFQRAHVASTPLITVVPSHN